MTKFFRKIRQKLISENRFNKYLLYAIGEILFVVIGILLALQVNNWSQERSERRLEAEYVWRLKMDLKQDIITFNDFISYNLGIKRDVLEVLGSANDVEDIIQNPVITGENLELSTYVSLPGTQSTTYEELKNNGSMRLIRNADIRLELDDYYDLHELIFGINQKSPGSYRQILYGSLPGVSTYESILNKREYTTPDKEIGFNLFLNHQGIQEAINLELWYTADMSYWLNRILTMAKNCLAALELEYPEN